MRISGVIAFVAIAMAGCAFVASGLNDRADPARPAAPREILFQEAWLDAGQVIPPHKGEAGGSMYGVLELATGKFEWRVTIARLTGPALSVGFYGPAGKGQNGPLALALPAFENGTGTLEGRHTLTQAQMDDLIAGKWYVSVVTRAFPGGETRGQVVDSKRGVHGG